jgi:hypothetical protein
MVEIHRLSSATTKQSLEEMSKSLRSSNSSLVHDTILYFLKAAEEKRNPRHTNTNKGSPIILVRATVQGHVHAHSH